MCGGGEFWIDIGNVMKLSCRLEVLPGRNVLEQITNAHRFGFEGIGLPGRFLDRYLEGLLASLNDLPIPLMSLSLGFEGSLLHPEAAERRRCQDSLVRLMDTCVQLGVQCLNVPPVLIQDNPVRLTDKGSFASLDARLDDLLEAELFVLANEARVRDLTVLIEPVNRFESDYLNSIEHGARVCRAVAQDAIGMTIDTFHMQLEELDSEAAIITAGSEVRHVHVAENTRVEPGVGALDLAAVFRGLQTIGYDEWIEVECRSLSGDAEKVLPSSVRYLQSVWAAPSAS